ncbi:Phosphate metabolism transcription protein [Verticillium nonalfalfae]|uniref:Phosphate metabolism transcription protein n=1 Tax=Verticillium nonalfalfae TaxID=1051616 RepID=A0A3M9XZ37_9PEZI|nr:Phosphate metabolism transcription protein [Verticillium nonalfalfae]RNJ53527.1 Phosphate metabolism transcription protein [Verticillium nonalfalfae]
MRFGKTLRESVYAPWKDKYIDYAKLKSLLREDKYEDEDVPWTEEDESRFCDEIFNTQLEKVAEFQEKTVEGLRERVDAAFEKLKDMVPAEDSTDRSADDKAKRQALTAQQKQQLKGLEAELDRITNEIGELKKYSNINYTAFLKIVKKHDRKRGGRYKVRPMMQLSLSRRPFNSEQGYSPLLNKLSILYYALRQQLEDEAADIQLPSELEEQGETHNGERYTAHKFWVHPDNLLEVKTYILRRLPALVYSEQSSKGLDVANDPTITSLYFDNNKFELYSNKVDRQAEASSFRVRWYGQLSSKPDLTLEQKTVGDHGSSEERRMVIKEKYVKPFLDGEYKMDKTIQKMKRQSQAASDVEAFRKTVDELDKFVQEKGLQPVLRANYVRSAFQKPSDDRVRISLDTELAFIREDTLDRDRPCRDPSQWHRLDIDDRNLTFPFKDINQSEVSRFPYAVLEIKLRDLGKKRPAWIEDLMGSHLVHPAPRFSKFVHGVASLFEDYVNNLPFWLSDLEGDIRKDPQKAFEAEEKRRSQRAEDEVAVGSFLGKRVSSYKASRSSPAGQSYLADRMAAEASLARSVPREPTVEEAGEPSEGREHGEEPEQGQEQDGDQRTGYGTLSAVLPSFSLSRYSRARHERERPLPEGVVEPSEWIKNTGELKIEPKVWLANERTFLKWQHICILLGGLAVSLYSAAGRNTLAEVMGIMYILIAVFAGGWGYWMMGVRRRMIIERSGKDFDNVIGPLVISVALMIALILNFVFAYRRAVERWDSDNGRNATESFSEELR